MTLHTIRLYNWASTRMRMLAQLFCHYALCYNACYSVYLITFFLFMI